jgi:hypothetical protein
MQVVILADLALDARLVRREIQIAVFESPRVFTRDVFQIVEGVWQA